MHSRSLQAVKDFFSLSFELDIQPSIWKYYKTPKFNRLMDAFEVMTKYGLNESAFLKEFWPLMNTFPRSLAKKHVDRAIERLSNQTENESQEGSVLQKILKVDKDYAVVMALDMLLAGIDTVYLVKWLTSPPPHFLF